MTDTTTAPAATTGLDAFRWWDIPAAAALEQELFPAEPWSAETFWSELAEVPRTRTYFAARDDDGLLGYAGVCVVGADADVQTLAVAPRAQGRGVGGALLDALLAEAAARGATTVFLEVRADNTAAQRLYAGRGFEQISRRRRYYADGQDALVLRRRIRGGRP